MENDGVAVRCKAQTIHADRRGYLARGKNLWLCGHVSLLRTWPWRHRNTPDFVLCAEVQRASAGPQAIGHVVARAVDCISEINWLCPVAVLVKCDVESVWLLAVCLFEAEHDEGLVGCDSRIANGRILTADIYRDGRQVMSIAILRAQQTQPMARFAATDKVNAAVCGDGRSEGHVAVVDGIRQPEWCPPTVVFAINSPEIHAFSWTDLAAAHGVNRISVGLCGTIRHKHQERTVGGHRRIEVPPLAGE